MKSTVPALGHLANYLRLMRRMAGLTYDELAERTGYSASHLKRTANGKKLPTAKAMLAFARGCVGEEGNQKLISQAAHLYLYASADVETAARKERRSTVVPKPQYATTPADISAAMRDAWKRAGKPPTRVMESRSGGDLPRSTAHSIAKGRTVPRDFRQYLAFLQACEIRGKALGPWFRAWFAVFGAPRFDAAVMALKSTMDHAALKALLDLYAQDEESQQKLPHDLERAAAAVGPKVIEVGQRKTAPAARQVTRQRGEQRFSSHPRKPAREARLVSNEQIEQWVRDVWVREASIPQRAFAVTIRPDWRYPDEAALLRAVQTLA
ncbi:helix-turn-helix domain-containing protein [Streptomyces avermitilis]|uniref:helix-turn-helix domain-containing protein n=1 Tax=Streptomyces avermitilis TaxID=33903 RepID=UPI0033A9B2E0